MPRHAETRILPHSPHQMFTMVADVARYPEFLPWVVAMRVRSDLPHETIADMIVGFKGLRETFSSRVIKASPARIMVDYLDGPMRHLHNEWQFTPHDSGGCQVSFMVDFSFRSSLFEQLAGQVFDRALRKMIGAFEDRANTLYGAGTSMSSSPVPGSIASSG